MNVYVVVEGNTEFAVFQAWFSILVPQMKRITDFSAVHDHNYYIMTSGGIPSIYRHVVNAIKDINSINSQGAACYDYLLVSLDTEDGSRTDIEEVLRNYMVKEGVGLNEKTKLVILEQKVCIETWLLGNRRVFKQNPQNKAFAQYIRHFNVSTDDPETMDTINEERFNKAQFHFDYLRKMLAERNMRYDKNNTTDVCEEQYLRELIDRYYRTKHITTFGAWYNFVMKELNK